jgi:hypothetical protein
MRHLTASIAGAPNLPFSAFTLFAYTGGLLWCLTFIGLGYFLGEGWTSGGMRLRTQSRPACRIRPFCDSPLSLAPHEDTEQRQLENSGWFAFPKTLSCRLALNFPPREFLSLTNCCQIPDSGSRQDAQLTLWNHPNNRLSDSFRWTRSLPAFFLQFGARGA